MTTDITELAQRMKAAAEKANSGEWAVQFGDEVYATNDGVDYEQVAIATLDARDADFIALANPANVLALVEALEKAQAKNALVAGGIEAAAKLHERIAELESRTVKLPPLNDDLIAILGRPNFMCAHLAELLRKSGEDIKRKAEHEQAAIIHWFLSIYLEHGDKWEGVAKSDMQARAAGIKWEGE